MEEDDQPLVLKSNADSMIAVTVGRVMSTLLSARPKKLQDAFSRFSTTAKSPSLGSLDESLWLLYEYVRDAVERGEQLDQIIIPMIEHSLQSKGSRRDDQVLRLLNWLCQDESISGPLTENLVGIISRKEDHYVAYGWCNLVRDLLDSETLTKQYLRNGLGENYGPLLKELCTCIPHLSSIACKGSCNSQDGYELPSRLAAAAADCFLAITEALTRKEDISTNKKKLVKSNASRESSSSLLAVVDDKKVKDTHKLTNMEKEKLLWNHMMELIDLVQRLLAWSKKSRPLHSRGLEGVLKWLLFVKENYVQLQDEADINIVRTGELLLSSCWKHYSMLLHLEDCKFSQHYREWLEQFLSGIKLCAERCTFLQKENNDGTAETRKFFLNCLCLLLGRLSGKRLQATMAEHGLRISEILLPQLKCGDEDDDVIDEVVCIFKETVFKLHCSSEGRAIDTGVDAVVATMLQILDETDGTARAVVMLIGEYCAIDKDNRCLNEVLDILAHGNEVQKRNAIDVISQLIHMASKSSNKLPHLTWPDIANHLLGCLSSAETTIIKVASDLLPMIDPSLVLPALVHLFYSSDQGIRSYVKDALIGVLKYHCQNPEVIPMLIDCLSDLNNSLDLPKTTGGVVDNALPKFDYDKVLQLTPEWSGTVEDWNVLVGPLIDKLYADPSNAIIVRLLSQISEHMADAADVVLQRVLLCMQGQEELDVSGTSSADSLFERLCPLLILRLLPLRVFTNRSSTLMYGKHPSQSILQGNLCADIEDDMCVATLLLKRAFSKYEFQDVRKLAAELCGRLDPLVLFPVVCYHMEKATSHQDVLKIKACLFSVCTSLVVRGKDIIFHPITFSITKLLETILMWPSTDTVEVSKAQHGCIDCMALMICAELESLTSFKESTSEARSKGTSNSFLTINYVVQKLMHNNATTSSSEQSTDNYIVESETPLPFQLCMANVLISACQKIGDSGKKHLARKTIPAVINSIEAIASREIKSACIQVLFSAVYHLKSAVLPYSSDLINLCLKFLKEGSEKERMACTKLLASLMASEDAILAIISGGLLEARSLLSTLSRADSSPEVRKACQQLLLCLTTP